MNNDHTTAKVINGIDPTEEKMIGSYGSSIVIMSSNPKELTTAIKKLGSDYRTVMEPSVMDNYDYVAVLIREDH